MNIRRIVTASDDKGLSYVKQDSIADNIDKPLEEISPEFTVVNLWTTTGQSLSPEFKEDPVAHQKKVPVSPSKNNTSFRFVNFPPENYLAQLEDSALKERIFERAGFDKNEPKNSKRHPLMHQTQTIDYAIVLSGEIFLLLDKEEVSLKAGDVVIQCGTTHTWNNRSNKDCLMGFVVLGA